MSILMVLIGATIGATIGSLFMHWRKDVAKERQQLESKTPYDYALTNAINERDRLQDELRMMQIARRVEKQVENYRNAIEEILAEDGEDPTEGTYERNIGMPIRDNGDGTFSPITWDNRISSGEMVDNISKAVARANGTNVREDDTEDEQSTEYDVDKAFMDSTDLTFRQYWDVLKTTGDKRHPDEAVSPTSWDARMSLEEWAKGVSKAFASGYGTNVREDDNKDERLEEDDEERSYIQSVGQAIRDRTIVCVVCSKARYLGEVTAFNSEHGELTELQVNGIDIRVEAILEIRKGDVINGETLYRKGNR